MAEQKKVEIVVTARDDVAAGADRATRSLAAMQQKAEEESHRARQKSLRGGGYDYLADVEDIGKQHQAKSLKIAKETESALKDAGGDSGLAEQIKAAAAERQAAADAERQQAEALAAKSEKQRESERRKAMRADDDAFRQFVADKKAKAAKAAKEEQEAISKEADAAHAAKEKSGEKAEKQEKARQEQSKKPKAGLRGIKDAFGEESGIGLLAKTLQGAGAIAGVTALAVGVQHVADGAAKFKEAMNDPKTNGTKTADAFLSIIPVVGGVAIALDEAIGGRRAKERSREMADALIGEMQVATRQIKEELSTVGQTGFFADRKRSRAAFQAQENAQGKQDVEKANGLNAGDRADFLAAAQRAAKKRRELFNAQEIEAAKAYDREQIQVATQVQRDLLAIETEGHAAKLRNSNNGAEADILALRQQAQQRIDAINDAADKAAQGKEGTEEHSRIYRQAYVRTEAIRKNAVASEAEAIRVENLRRENEFKDFQERLTSLQGDAQVERLKLQGRDADASLLSLEADQAKQIQAIRRAMDEKVKIAALDPDQGRGQQSADLARRKAEAEIEAIKRVGAVKAEQIRQQDQYAKIDKAISLEAQLQGYRLQGIQALASAGDAQAQKDAAALQRVLAEKAAQEEILRLKRDQTLTDEQRAALGKASKEVRAIKLFGDLTANLNGGPGSVGKPSLVSGRFIEGGIQSAEFYDRNTEQIKLARKQAESMAKIEATNQAMAASLAAIAGHPVQFVSIFGP